MNACLAVFDMVGTTVQAGDEVPSAFRDAMASVGVQLPDEAIAGIRGRSKRDAIADLLGAYPPTRPEGGDVVGTVYARFQGALRAAYRARARPVAGAEEVFLALRRFQVETVLNTGLDRETAELLHRGLGWDALGLGGLVTGDDVTRGRPAPDLIRAAMRLGGVEDPRRVVAVGDTTSDLAAAAAAGVGWSIGVLGGAHPRDQLESRPHSVILESVAEVPGWLVAVGALAPPPSPTGLTLASVEIHRVDPSGADARWCLARYFEELAERFEGGFRLTESIVADHSDLVPPNGSFLVARVSGTPVACGAVKRVSDQVGYIKRMWVDRSARGLGLGRRLLEALEASATELGCTVAQLETNRVLTEAIRLYQTAGYREVEPFNDERYAHHWFEKRLG